MPQPEYPPELLEKIKAVTSKRPKTVIDHILKHGHITTEELENTYGYAHAPRAARDVREAGIPLDTFKVLGSNGRSIAAYKFGDLSQIRGDKLGGRKIFSKEFKSALVKETGGEFRLKCAICSGEYEERYLQVDHRVPYEVSGDQGWEDRNLKEYMLLDGSCNRAKSWSCEHCENWKSLKDKEVCGTCYWASPEEYKHIAMKQSRRIDLVWNDEETDSYDALHEIAVSQDQKMPDFVKDILKKRAKE